MTSYSLSILGAKHAQAATTITNTSGTVGAFTPTPGATYYYQLSFIAGSPGSIQVFGSIAMACAGLPYACKLSMTMLASTFGSSTLSKASGSCLVPYTVTDTATTYTNFNPGDTITITMTFLFDNSVDYSGIVYTGSSIFPVELWLSYIYIPS